MRALRRAATENAQSARQRWRWRWRWRPVLALLLLAAGLTPLFQTNLLAPGDTYFFSNWDKESQALVLAEIERVDGGAGPSRFGLQNAQPDVLSPYENFDSLPVGTSTTGVAYAAYPSSLGMQGRLFTAVHALGCRTLGCLNTVESGLFSAALVAFIAMLALITRRSLAVTVLISAVLSPWVTSAAHNLYWVPWTWLLPSIAAAGVVLARSPRARRIAVVLVGAATAVKASTGYEFLTTTTLLAASMPVLAQALTHRQDWRTTLRQSVWIFASAVAGFLLILAVHAVVTGSGDAVAGLQAITQDALKRTYGPSELGRDGITSESLRVSPLKVLALYLVDWRSSVFSLGIGGPFTVLALGPGAFWVLIVVTASIPIVDYLRGIALWRRDAVMFIAAALPPISWFIIGKSHSWTATSVNFVLWYWILIPVLLWLIGSRVARSAFALRTRAAYQLLERDAAVRRDSRA